MVVDGGGMQATTDTARPSATAGASSELVNFFVIVSVHLEWNKAA